MMGVYIKNMKMPGACLACDFCNPFAEEPYCRRLMKITPKTTTLPDCPLVSVPPHGRLIDADALIDAGWQLSRDNIFTGKYEIALLSSVPTIIEAEGRVNHENQNNRN